MGKKFKFDVVIGNPPYQDETIGDNKTFAPPIYHLFIDAAKTVGNIVEFIHPARFLFNAGSTPKAWNNQMLHNKHLKVLYYEPDTDKVFPGLSTPIKGGVAVTILDSEKDFGEIDTFTPYMTLNKILHKVVGRKDFVPLASIIFARSVCRLTDVLHKDFPNAKEKISKGHMYDVGSNVFDIIPEVFSNSLPEDGNKYIKLLGRNKNGRIYKYIKAQYIRNDSNLDKFKVFVPNVSGTGMFGEILSSPIVGTPFTGSTETFISIGAFGSLEEAESSLKYIKTKFVRALLGVLKVTHHNSGSVWGKVPLQDFTSNSDIDWSKSIHEIDLQLYKKYNLSDEEIQFIESHVKEMA